MTNVTLAHEHWTDEDMRAELWASFIQRGWEGLPTDKALRDMLWSGISIAINEWVSSQNIKDKLRRELKNSDDTVKSLRTALADNNDIRQAQLLRLIEMLKLIVETPVTHGQKNGMILLVAEIAQRMSSHDLYMGDIPF